MIFGSPLRGPLHPVSWKRPPGNLDFHVSQPFGCTGFPAELPYGNCAHFHRGIDMGNGDCGADVLAVAAGKVTLAGKDALSGNAIRVWIEHPGGWFSGYYHLHDEQVTPGQNVVTGQVIGHVGTTGWSTACHLHFEVHANSDRLSFFDPWPHLAQNVTVHPVLDRVVNIRTTAGSGSTPGPLYAVSAGGVIVRASDKAAIGASTSPYPWGDVVNGATYTVDGVTSNKWDRIYLGGAYRFIASELVVRSVA